MVVLVDVVVVCSVANRFSNAAYVSRISLHHDRY